MPPERSSELPPAVSAGPATWRWLVWAALVLFAFNFWAISLRHWPGALDFEVPSRSALADGHWWTVLTYALTGTGIGIATQWLSGPLSLLFLAMASRLAETNLIRRDFLALGAACAIGAAVFWLPLHWAGGESLRAGCMVLVLGFGAFLCFALPDEPLPLTILPTLEVRPQAFFWFVLALETGAFLSFELPQVLGHPGVFQANFDHSAHLGALVTGWACASYWQRAQAQEELAQILEEPTFGRQAVTVGATRVAEVEAVNTTVSNRRELREAVDRILDKINHGGFDSLSAQERQILTRAKDLLGK
jgi:hypothetical protein